MSGEALGVDVGGTFTDVVSAHDGRIVIGKVLTTPDDQSLGVVAGIDVVGDSADRLVHGTTIATNALLERAGARTVLITTEGFEDVLEIGRQDRPSLYDSFSDRPAPLVDQSERLGVPREGPFDVAEIVRRSDGAEAIAISLIDSFVDATREEEVAACLEGIGGDVSLSSRVAPEFREYERTSTTVLNAYLTPRVKRYLSSLVEQSRRGTLPTEISVMRSSGGLMPAEAASDLAASLLLSGPAGGVVAAAALGSALGHDHVISFDMGGTSTDVCRIDHGRPEVAYERPIDGYPCRLPAVAVHTVGAGGGSIAAIDPGGALRVGPQSSGAVPGPACYGRGGADPTVTDANVVLGRIDPAAVLGASVRIRPELAERAVGELADSMGRDATDAARGIVSVVEEVMAGAIRKVSIAQGADPREAVLVAFGGAGGLHVGSLAAQLGMAGAIVPPYAGVFSALGLLLSPPRVDAARSVLLRETEAAALAGALDAVRADALATEGTSISASAEVSLYCDVRYLGQAHEIAVPVGGADWQRLVEDFDRLHRVRNGFSRPGDPIEVVTVRAEAVDRPTLTWDELPEAVPVGSAAHGRREVSTAGGAVTAPVFRREGLPPGTEVVGPAVIEAADSTILLRPNERASVHPTGALEIEF